MRLDRAVSLFLGAQVGHLSVKTIGWYDHCLRHLVNILEPQTRTSQLTQRDFLYLRNELLQSDISVAYRNGVIRSTKRLFRWLTDMGELGEYPIKSLPQFKDKSNKVRAISMEDFWKMHNNEKRMRHYRNVAILRFLISTGCRAGGLCGLVLDNLILESCKAWVTEKGNRSRWVFFDEGTGQALRDYLQHERPIGGDHVFLSTRVRPLTSSTLGAILVRIGSDAGVTGVHNTHSFRHAFAINYLRNGGDLSSLSEILGHSSISITHDHYTRWTQGHLKSQHKKFNPLHED